MPADTIISPAPLTERSSCLAVVPAYNEEATVGERDRRAARTGAAARRRGRRRRLDRRDRRAAPRTPAHGCCACRSTSGSAARCRPASSTPTSTATTTWSRSTATASTTRARSQSCSRRSTAATAPDMICGSRFATPTGYIAPISRRTGIHLFAFLLSRLLRQPITDPTSGLPPLQPPGDRAVRARLPARLPRGRGGADAAPPPADHARGAGADVPARRRRLLDQLRQVASTT